MKIHEISTRRKPKVKRFNDIKSWKVAINDASNGQYKTEIDNIDDVTKVIKNGIIVGQWDGKDNEGWVIDYDYEYGQLTLAKLRKLFEV